VHKPTQVFSLRASRILSAVSAGIEARRFGMGDRDSVGGFIQIRHVPGIRCGKLSTKAILDEAKENGWLTRFRNGMTR
jgi:hypothetical protein